MSEKLPAHVARGATAGQRAPLSLYLVRRLQLASRTLLDDELRPLGLTTPQYTVLSMLDGRSGLSLAELTRRGFVRQQTMHELVRGLEARGIVRREPDPSNRRVRLITLTETGEQLMADCAAGVLALDACLSEGLTAREQATFRKGLMHGASALADEARRRGLQVSTD